MYCPICGTEMLPNAKFCPNCGTSKDEKTIKNKPNDQIACPKTYLVESILVTLFCCLPFGVVGLINAANVSSNFAAGRYEEAKTASLNAKKYLKLGIIITGVACLIYLIILLIMIATNSL